jgi:replicative DNA helicase
MKERMVPQNIEAEQGVLGSILIDPEVYDLVSDLIKVDDFYRDAHRIIYQSIMSLQEQGTSPDNLTVCDELERTNKLESAGGSDYIIKLMGEVPTSGNAEYYAKIVARTAINRKLAHAAGMIAALAYSQDPQSLEKSEQIIFSLQSNGMSQAFTGMPEMVGDYMTELDYLNENKGTYSGVPTGYTDIDNTLGGLQKTDLILLGGRPGSGKTSLGLCMAYNTALQFGKKVAVFSLEMGKRQLMRRMMSMASKVDLQRLRSGWIADAEWETIMQKAGDLSQLPIWVNDTAGNPIASMRSQLRRLIQQQDGIDLVVVDYLGLIGPDEGKESENRVQEISKISGGLKRLAKEFDVPVLV